MKMLLKIIGAILIILAGCLIGNDMSRRLEEREKVYEKLWLSLLYIKNCIQGPMLPLGRIYKDLSLEKGILQSFFTYISDNFENTRKSPEEIWKTAAENHISALKSEEKAFLADRGRLIGQSNKKSEIEELEAFMEFVKEKELICREIKSKKAGMYRGLGFFAGLAMAVMML